MKTVVVGLSGGVDSAVACFLLKQQGYRVIAVFMQNWDSYVNKENYNNAKDKCDAQYEWEDAQKIATALDIELHQVIFIKEYWDEVFSSFLKDYKSGITPNPDVLCNRYIKFGHLLDHAINKLHADYLATGHYAGIVHYEDRSELMMAKDNNKDQTYFLCDLNQQQLQKVLFPLSSLTKQQVREIAQNNNIPVWDKKDSTGICFIGKRNFKDFLSNYIPAQPGDIVDIQTNEIIGHHIGVMYYTIGQNENLGLGGQLTKYFVCKKDIDKKILYVVSSAYKHQYLASSRCYTSNFNWINKPKQNTDLWVRFRHRQALCKCSINILDDNCIEIIYPQEILAVACGQYSVIYEDNQCLGGGIISKVFTLQ